MTLYLGTKPIAGNSSSRNIGEIVASTVPLTDAGLHLLDGSLVSGSGSYSAFVDYIAGLVSNYPDLFETEANWQNAVITYGVCGKFVYDSTNNTVRLPKITGFTEGTTDVTALGDLIEAGLPDFDAVFVNHARDYTPATDKSLTPVSGAIAVKSDMYPKSSYPDVRSNSTGSYYYDQTVEIRPSISNSIYGNSSTVQPQSIKVLYYICIASSVKTSIEVDIDEIATDLNSKADVDLTNVNASGASLASGWSMPSSRYIDLTLGASGATYTAPANGWFVLDKRGNAGQYLRLGPKYGFFEGNYTSNRSNEECFSVCPVKKGDVVTVVYTTSGNTEVFKFYYAEGEKNV